MTNDRSYVLYLTGDLGKWRSDGNIEFLGRKDQQVKIRGYRIEKEEIEKQLLTNKTIKKTVVIDKEDENGNKFLCGYIVLVKPRGDPISVSELRKHLSGSLPDYMIPTHFIEVDEIPLTTNGKIDEKALHELGSHIGIGTEYVAPGNELEEKLASMWSEILKKEQIGIYDNFFDLGGQSLIAMRLMSMINETFQIRFPLILLFQVSNIKGLAKLIIEKQAASISTSASTPNGTRTNGKKPRTFAEIKFEKKKRRKIKV